MEGLNKTVQQKKILVSKQKCEISHLLSETKNQLKAMKNSKKKALFLITGERF